MPRRRTIFLKGNSYHIFGRGDRKDAIFNEPEEYLRFLQKGEDYRRKYGHEIIAYCLLTNHLHLLLKQTSDIPVSKYMSVLLSSHSHYLSTKYQLSPGHVFQSRFGSRMIESEADFANTSRYIHLNPIKEKILAWDFTSKTERTIRDSALIRELRQYPWSSYGVYLGKIKTPMTIAQNYLLAIEKDIRSYRHFVESKITDEQLLEMEKF